VSAGTLASALGLAGRALATRAVATRPFKVTLALTDRCDCRCTGCLIWRRPKGREMTPGEIGTFLAAAPSIRWVNLTGGEPALRDDLVEVARAVRTALPSLAVLSFPTTGRRTETIVAAAREIAAMGVPRFYVTCSVEGPPDVHDRLRGRAGAFERMTATYRALREVPGMRVQLGLTLSDQNAHLVGETLRALRAAAPGVGWRDLHLNVYTTSPHYYDNLAAPVHPPEDVTAAIAPARRARERSAEPSDRIEATYLRLLPRYLRTRRSPIPCRSLVASVFVAAGGDVHPCTVWSQRLGNVLERPLYEILEGAAAARARRVIARDACPGCWSPCEAHPTIVASAPGSLLAR
jgi:MoaA/NifB/PqqE/SkfB family radical SAM enzyme